MEGNELEWLTSLDNDTFFYSNGTRNWHELRRSGRTNAQTWIIRMIRSERIRSYFMTRMPTGKPVSDPTCETKC